MNCIRVATPTYCKFSKFASFSVVTPHLYSFNTKKNEFNGSEIRKFHTGSTFYKLRAKTDRKNILASVPAKEEGAEGEKAGSIDNIIRGFGERFPDENTPDKLFGGARFADLPIVHVSTSRNNTIFSFSDAKGMTMLRRSCGVDGFKNTKKGTNVAAQVTGQTLGVKILEKGFKNVRVAVQGLGPGRVASLKGLALSGLNVASISDVTPISFYITPRPRKAKKK